MFVAFTADALEKTTGRPSGATEALGEAVAEDERILHLPRHCKILVLFVLFKKTCKKKR